MWVPVSSIGKIFCRRAKDLSSSLAYTKNRLCIQSSYHPSIDPKFGTHLVSSNVIIGINICRVIIIMCDTNTINMIFYLLKIL